MSSKPKRRMTAVKLKILAIVLKHRLLAAEQIQKRCLPRQKGQSQNGRQEYTRKLLRELYRDKYLLRRTLIEPELGKSRYVYACTWTGAQTVAEKEATTPDEVGWDAQDKVITWSNENLHHLVRENDVQWVFEQAAMASGVNLQEWQSDRVVAKEKVNRRVQYTGPHGGKFEKTLIPDGMYLFAWKTSANGRTGTVTERLFVEIDMGSQTISQRKTTIKHPQRTWEHKVRSYMAYFQPGGQCEQHYGSSNARVLVLTTSELRMQRIKEATERVGGTDRFWFATFEQFSEETALSVPIYLVATQGVTTYPLLDMQPGGG